MVQWLIHCRLPKEIKNKKYFKLRYTIDTINKIVGGNLLQWNSKAVIENLLLDSRKLITAPASVFFALKASHRNGHKFLDELYHKGVRNFVVSDDINGSLYPEANIIKVDDTLKALQILASYHRKQFTYPVIGITGSNGKTIVKEWLYQLLQDRYNIVRSPKSYNSQIGVPLSVWQMNETHTLGIFEAGISKTGEMKQLESIVQPAIGVFTNIGEAHNEGFENLSQKANEKALLFQNAETIIFCEDYKEISNAVTALQNSKETPVRIFSWSREKKNVDLFIANVSKENGKTLIDAVFNENPLSIEIYFEDDASVENAITCWSVLLQLEINQSFIQKKMKLLQPVNMRLELKKGINHCNIINDSYSADVNSLSIALDFLQQQATGNSKSIILSDFLQSGLPETELYQQIAVALKQHQINKLIGIGEKISSFLPVFLKYGNIQQYYFPDTENFIQHFRFSTFKDETILIKGARKFEFEKIVFSLEQKVHQTVLEINLNALTHNLNEYRKILQPGTRIMTMVKAFSYGSGGAEIAGKLQYNKVDYLAVAYTDEAVELRKSGITLPLMVMNPEENSFSSIIEYALEPDIFSLTMLRKFDAFVKQQGLQHYPVHLEIETGMNRLGIAEQETDELIRFLNSTSQIKVQSIFTHLAAGEEEEQDTFTDKQYDLFLKIYSKIENELGHSVLRHISNSAAIIRHPDKQLDMVRLGIGLYGIDSSGTNKLDLQPVATLRSTIAQIKKIKAGESVSYNRKAIVEKDTTIATVRIGYADGFSRKFGNGVGKMWVKGAFAPVIGTVCMDMTMIDISDIPGVLEGDDVIIIGKELPVQQLAAWAQTIPYEIMTGISQRVKRVYYEE